MVCIQDIPRWGNIQEKREEQPEGYGRCERYNTCNRPKDKGYHERYCMNMGEGCERMYTPTTEERRMDI